MSNQEIIIRIILATAMAGIVGYERESKNRPAGMKTHILVCVGATTLGMVEIVLGEEMISYLTMNPDLPTGFFSMSLGRITAQIVSGIGFLGAGTIVITRKNILGLTTAASIWIVACLGIVIGYGLYEIATISFMVIMTTLLLSKKVFRINVAKKLEIKFRHRIETKDFIKEYFDMKKIIIKDVDFNVEVTENGNIYTNIYTVDFDKELNYTEIIDEISLHKNILKIRTINL